MITSFSRGLTSFIKAKRENVGIVIVASDDTSLGARPIVAHYKIRSAKAVGHG